MSDTEVRENRVHIGVEGAEAFLGSFASGRAVVLVAGGKSYVKSGAAALVDPVLKGAFRLTVTGADPKLDEVQAQLDRLSGRKVEAFVAVGGGTVIDTAKLINAALSAGCSVRELLARRELPPTRSLLAVPTTDGTGSEASAEFCMPIKEIISLI